MKHTPEPWHTFAFEIYDQQEQIIADCGYSEDYWGKDGCKANAARIVQCVNACEGMGDPETVWGWMKSVKVNIAGTPDFKTLLAEIEQLKAERDELRAKLEGLK
jgi:hypothetical protein